MARHAVDRFFARAKTDDGTPEKDKTHFASLLVRFSGCIFSPLPFAETQQELVALKSK